MNDHKLLDPLQSAYRVVHSTETALFRIHNDILRIMDSSRAFFLVMLDLSAAFNTLDHEILLQRTLSSWSIRDRWNCSSVVLGLLHKKNTLGPCCRCQLWCPLPRVWCLSRICYRSTCVHLIHYSYRGHPPLAWSKLPHVCWWHSNLPRF